MSNDASDEIIANTPWGDVQLHGMSWDEGGRDVILHLRMPGLGQGLRRLACRWAHGLVVQLEFPEGRGGFPLSWGATFARLPDGTLAVRFDFAHSGEIRLNCNDLAFVENQVDAT